MPGLDDTAVINSGNPVVNATTSVGSVNMANSTGLTVASGATLTIVNTFTQRGTVDGDGDLVIESDWYWLRGQHNDDGETTSG